MRIVFETFQLAGNVEKWRLRNKGAATGELSSLVGLTAR